MSSELDALIGKRVVIELEYPTDDDPPTDIEGKFLAYSSLGWAVETKEGPIVVHPSHVMDIHEVTAPTKIVRRNLREIPESQARQHLADRHAILWSLLKMTNPRAALMLHDRINHDDLGHRHRPRKE